jgi:hypothetical protein
MPIVTDDTPTFALYYRVVLGKPGYSRGGGELPIATAGQWPQVFVGAGIAETKEEIGMKIWEGIYKRFNDSGDHIYHLLFQNIAFLGREIEGRLHRPLPGESQELPTNDVHNPCSRVCLVVGDMPQAYVPITHFLLRGAFPLHVVCPCRQHFYIAVEGGPDDLYDSRVWWFSLEGFRYREEQLLETRWECPHCGTAIYDTTMSKCPHCDKEDIMHWKER